MRKLLILSRQAEEYQHLLKSAKLPEIQIFSATDVDKAKAFGSDFEIVFGEPRLMRDLLLKSAALALGAIHVCGC